MRRRDNGPTFLAVVLTIGVMGLSGSAWAGFWDSFRAPIRPEIDTSQFSQPSIRCGDITTVAGNGQLGDSGDGGKAVHASIDSAYWSLATDSNGNLYFNAVNRIRIVNMRTGNITTVAGNGSEGFSGDGGRAVDASFYTLQKVALDSSNNIYIADLGSFRIRKVDVQSGIVMTIAGNGQHGFSGDGGPATEASLGLVINGLAFDRGNNLYIYDGYHNRIRRVDAQTGIITTVEREDLEANVGAPKYEALTRQVDTVYDSWGNRYFVKYGDDSSRARVRRVDASSGITSTVAGNGQIGFSGDGGPAVDASLSDSLQGLTLDSSGNLYIIDEGNHRIRKVHCVVTEPDIKRDTAPLPYSKPEDSMWRPW